MFYIQPPKGLVMIHTLEEIVFSRLEFLHVLDKQGDQTFEGKFEYLLEGSVHDYIGHFIIRLLLSQSEELFSYWFNKETLLFKIRLSHMQPKQIYRFFRTILRHIKRREKVTNPVDDALIQFTTFYLSPKTFKHIVSKQHSKQCTKYHQTIDFELIPDLIEKKTVDLCRGLAIVYCSQWKELIQSLFKTFVSFERKVQNSVEHVLADPRFNAIYQKLNRALSNKEYNCGTITASNIDKEISNFPPCMAHLHYQLRHKHRLSHYARLYYSLFLKECGMSLEDALIYWRNEYSKPHNCTSLCKHDWQTDAKKFTYSIRHMYGLEGGRKNYKAPNCKNICEQISGSNYEGGCPFNNFDSDSLKSLLLKLITKDQVNEYMLNLLDYNPQYSCAKFFNFKNDKNDDISIIGPVQYYKLMTKTN